FKNELPDDTPAARSKRRSHGNLVLPAARFAEKQIGNIAACDEQQQSRRKEHDHQRCLGRTRFDLLLRLEVGAVPLIQRLHFIQKSKTKVAEDAVGFTLCGFKRYSASKP